jgi:hypothetical protein
LWRDADGRIFAYTDREYFLYHFPGMLETYMTDLKKNLGYQKETSLVFGIDYYHYVDGGHMLGVILYLIIMDTINIHTIMHIIITDI